jgi:hypothetical protein
MTATTTVLQASFLMIFAGAGLGVFFSILTLAVQNAIPRRQLGVGTAATRYLQQAGGTMGVAIVGTVVNNTISSDIAKHLPAGAQQLTAAGLASATNPQVLVNPTYRDTVITIAKHYAEHGAVAAAQAQGKIPSGPAHAAVAAQIAQQAAAQAQRLLEQIFTALKGSLALGIQHGLTATLCIGLVMLVAAFFLKDVPLRASWGAEPHGGVPAESQSAKAAPSRTTTDASGPQRGGRRQGATKGAAR